MHFRAIEIQQTHPVRVAGFFEYLLGIAKRIQSLCEPPQLHESDAVVRCGPALFEWHSEFCEFEDGTLRENCRVFREAKLNVNFGFVQIAQRAVALAARNLEPFAETAKRVQGLTISAPQKLKIRAVVAGLCGKLEKLRVVAQSPALFVQFVGFLELVDI